MYKMHHPKSDVDRLYLPRTEDVKGSYNWSFPTSQPPSVLINTSGRRRHPPTLCQRPWRQETLVLHQQTVYEVQSGTGSACNTTCRGWGEHHPCPQNKGQGQTPGSPTAQVQVGIKSAPRQIPTTGETGWREPRQDPQMAKSSWPLGRNRGLYHRSPRSKFLNRLVPTQHPQEAWRGPKM